MTNDSATSNNPTEPDDPEDLNTPPTYSGTFPERPAPRRTRRVVTGVAGGFGPFDTERRMPPTEYGGE